jgi:putative ABC transport system permease protein
MIINYRLVFRNLFKDKSFPVLNIIGLAISFSCVFTVIVWIKNEVSYDRHLPQAERIYRLTFETSASGTRLHFARCNEEWISGIPASFPQVEQLVRLSPFRHTGMKAGDNKFYSDKVFATDSNFFSVFSTGLVSGRIDEVLKKPYSAVISRSMAGKFFGAGDPVGKIIELSGEFETKMSAYTVTGVMDDSPKNSHIHFDVLTSFVRPEEPAEWAYVYLLLTKGSKPEELLKGLPAYIRENEKESADRSYTPFLQKITDIHLHSDKDREIEQNGNITRLWLFAAIALVLLLISWINFYNLNKARVFSLSRQIHILRISGSGNGLIFLQYLAESCICVFSSAIIGLLFLLWFGNSDNALTASLDTGSIHSILIKQAHLIFLIITASVVAGTLPVFVYLTTGNTPGRTRFTSYAILMTGQFCLSVVMLVAALTINRQKDYIISRSPGQMSSDIIVLRNLNWAIRGKYSTIKKRALESPYIKEFTATMEEPGGETADAMQPESPEIDAAHKDNLLFVISVEDNFIDFFSLPLIAGRNFPQYNPERKGEDYILNEQALKKLGWTAEEAVGRPIKIKFFVPDIFYGGQVVGVVRDFNYANLKQEIKPYIFFQKPIFYICFLIRIDPANRDKAISYLREIWDQELPEYPFGYEFLDELYKSTYRQEISQSSLSAVFSVLAVIIVILGLFSVTSVIVTRRTKETGIRKVNGASSNDILRLLNSDFLKWTAIAIIAAVPLSYYLMNKWLQNFVYHENLEWWIFIVAAGIVTFVTILTVTVRAWKASRQNPVDSLHRD